MNRQISVDCVCKDNEEERRYSGTRNIQLEYIQEHNHIGLDNQFGDPRFRVIRNVCGSGEELTISHGL